MSISDLLSQNMHVGSPPYIHAALIDMWVGMISLMFVFKIAQVTLLLSPISLRHFLQTSKLTAFSLCCKVPSWNAVSPSA